MSDFVQTMKDWRRMCATYSTCDDDCCKGCPVLDYDNGCGEIYEMGAADWKKYENAIAKWAAEHPEPKYPTWIEWLEEIGVAGRLPSVEPVFTENQEFYLRKLGFTPKAHIPIPADLAEKLGLEPKNNIQKPSLKR